MATTNTAARWDYSVRRVDLPAGGYEPSPASATFATLAEAKAAAAEYAADAAGCYTPRIYEVRTRGRRVVCAVRVQRSHVIATAREARAA
jgi:hypothetical protein